MGRPRRPAYDSRVRAALTSFWNEPPVADPPRRVWRDWALVALLVPACVVEAVVREDLPYRWLSLAVALAGIPFLLVRRTHPLCCVALVFGPALALNIPWLVRGGDGNPPGLNTYAYCLLFSYALFRWGSGRHGVMGLGIMLVPATVITAFENSGASEPVGGFVVFFAVVAVALAVRYRTRARASQLDEVRAREREALARDLHDTVAHHLSAIAIRAQAGIAVAAADPGAAVESLRIIDAEASRTLAEMRTIVRELRTSGPAEFTPLPGIVDVREFAQTAPGDPPVHVDLDGDPEGVPAPVAAAAYRLVQESITNARRHARRATRIDVLVRTGADVVTVEVTDDGDASIRTGEGFGIVGMVERAERLGGTCVAGPRHGGGWAVTAVLPLRGASA